MTNEKVITRFLDKRAGHTPTRNITNGVYVYKGETLKTNGLELINYSTRIAYWYNDILYVNTRKYSSTTSRIQSKLRRLADERGLKVIEYKP